MRKTDKKIDNQIRTVLTQICEDALEQIPGFQWLTHTVNYTNFPKSLKVICVFDTNDSLDCYMLSECNDYLQLTIKKALEMHKIKLINVTNQVMFDSEENCEKHHKGNWAKRLNQ